MELLNAIIICILASSSIGGAIYMIRNPGEF